MPVPFKVSTSEVASVNPFKSSAAPVAATIVPAPIVPNGVLGLTPAAPSLSVPALIVVNSVYVFKPERIKVPTPVLVTATDVAVPLLITPLYAAGLVPSPPIVKVHTAPVPECVKLPEPVNDPTLRLVFAMSKVPLVIVSKPEIVVVALNVTPLLLLIVKFL